MRIELDSSKEFTDLAEGITGGEIDLRAEPRANQWGRSESRGGDWRTEYKRRE